MILRSSAGRLRPIAAALLALAVGVSMYRFSNGDGGSGPGRRWAAPPFVAEPIDDKPSAIEAGEDRAGRLRYEWMMLRDPATGLVPEGMRTRELQFARTLPKRTTLLEKTTDVLRPAATWNQRGPINIGGRTRALAVDVTNSNILFAGGVSGGMWRSVDAGASWNKLPVADGLQSVSCIVQDRRAGRRGTWYYGTGELRGNSAAGGGGSVYRGDGIYKSVNGGTTWTKLASTSTNNVQFDQPFDYVWNIALSPDTTTDLVVAATIGTIQRSTDGGQTWTAVLGTISGSNGPRYTDVICTPTGVFYATASSINMNLNAGATGAGIWRSTDGLTWTNIKPAGWPANYSRVVVAYAPSDEHQVYFVGETPGATLTDHGIFKYTYLSGDGSGAGGIWEDRSANLPNESGLDGNAKFDTQNSYDLVAAVGPSNPNLLFVGCVNLYRSLDGFATTASTTRIGGYASPSTYARYTNNHPDHHALVFDPADATKLYDGNDGGVYRSVNASAGPVTWTPLNNGFNTTQFYAVAIDEATVGAPMLFGGMQDNGTWYATTADGFNPWFEIAGGDGGFCAIAPGGTVSYVSLQNGTTYRLTSSTSGRIDPSGGTGYLFISPYILDPANAQRMYFAAGTTIWRNDNLAGIPMGSSNPQTQGWVSMPGTAVSGAYVTALGASVSPPNILYYGSSNGRLFRVNQASASNPSVVEVGVGKGLPASAYVSSIEVDPVNAEHVLIAFANYGIRSVFVSANGGDTWQDVSGNLEEQPDGSGNGPSVRWAAMVPDTTAYYYLAATSIGVYSTRTLAGSATVWAQEAPGTIGTAVATMIAVRPTDGTIVVGTHGSGVYSASVPVVPPTPPPVVPVPEVYALSRNYPNPFNAGTVFEVEMPATGHAKVRIVDIAGRLVATPFEGTLSRPGGVVNWDGRKLDGTSASSGVYIAVLEAGGTVSARKVVLIR